jgi:hypothetical protein
MKNIKKKEIHDSDCATNSEPAYPKGKCNCRLSATNNS